MADRSAIAMSVLKRRVCILSSKEAIEHRQSNRADCRSHSHCWYDTALAYVVQGDAVWTNRARMAIQMDIKKWTPRESDGYSVLQLVSD